jgi:hypothetical protein
MRAEDEVDPRGDLARNAGVASFGLNLPWRRPRAEVVIEESRIG